MYIYNTYTYIHIYIYIYIRKLQTSGGLWKYYSDEPALGGTNFIIDFSVDNNNSILFKFKEKITGQTGITGAIDVEIMVPLKYLSNF